MKLADTLEGRERLFEGKTSKIDVKQSINKLCEEGQKNAILQRGRVREVKDVYQCSSKIGRH